MIFLIPGKQEKPTKISYEKRKMESCVAGISILSVSRGCGNKNMHDDGLEAFASPVSTNLP